MTLLNLFSILLLITQDVPYKPDTEFEIKFNFSFKSRTQPSPHEVHLTETRAEYEKRTSTSPVPYLELVIKLPVKGENEERLKVVRDSRDLVYTKKIKGPMEFDLELGFVDDLKDKVKGYLHVISFYDKDRKEVSRIVIEFDEEGHYFVNGQKRGKV